MLISALILPAVICLSRVCPPKPEALIIGSWGPLCQLLLEGESYNWVLGLWALILPAVICLSQVCPPQARITNIFKAVCGQLVRRLCPKRLSPFFKAVCGQLVRRLCPKRPSSFFKAVCAQLVHRLCPKRPSSFWKQSVDSWRTDCAQKEPERPPADASVEVSC